MNLLEEPGAALAIRCVGACVSHGGRPILRDVHLGVAPGHQVAVTGPSGSGKTTLLHMLSGIVVPTRGRVVVAGHDLAYAAAGQGAALRRRKVAMVVQFGRLLPELTVAENVALPLRIRGRPARADRVRQALADVGIESADAWPAQLSAGETQRVAVVRALVGEPEILLCDEPTGSLDASDSQQVIHLLTRSAAKAGTTLVVVTRDRAVVARMQEAYALHNGALLPAPPR